MSLLLEDVSKRFATGPAVAHDPAPTGGPRATDPAVAATCRICSI